MGKRINTGKGVGFLVHKDTVITVVGCRPASSRLITIRLRAVPFNITVLQAYASTSRCDDNEVENSMICYRMSMLCKETGMQKWARTLLKTGKAFVDTSTMKTQMREDSDFWS